MSASFDLGEEIVWRPNPDYLEQAHLTRFMRIHGIASYADLMQRSTREIAWFTQAVLEYLDVRFYHPYSKIVDLSAGIAWPRWCVDGKMNIVHNCLDKKLHTPAASRPAVIWEGEEGKSRRLTYHELYHQVNQAANALRRLGLGRGDVIGLYMPMTPEVVIALLAIAKIGGIILPLFSGFGVGALVSRLTDADARALIVADGMVRKGKTIPMLPSALEAAAQVPTLEHVLVVARLGLDRQLSSTGARWWHDWVSVQPEHAETEITAADETLMLIYTSGTTGRPKGAVHTHCGFPIKAAQDMAFGTDLHPGQVITWITDIGWMMGPWLIFGACLLGGTIFLYDGAPDYPGPDRLWEMVERHRITTLGVSPTLIRTLAAHGEEPLQGHDLSSLRFLASTGEPWNPDPWKWLFYKVGRGRIPIINYSGGTEVSGGILMGNPILPLKPCAFSAACPGMAADVFDDAGHPVRNQVGELVITAPWIGMTRGFWKDPQRYEETYWSRWPNTWVHGDFAAIDRDGMWYILGRSDDTIKVAGKRLGPAEIESVLVSHPDVVEAAAIGVPDEIKGNQVVVFCVLSRENIASDSLRAELRRMVEAALGKPMAPKEILFVQDLPKTRNAKVMRRMIRAAYLGEDPGDTSSLVNPEAVEEIYRVR